MELDFERTSDIGGEGEGRGAAAGDVSEYLQPHCVSKEALMPVDNSDPTLDWDFPITRQYIP
jgi:hypothetical protein